MKRYEGMFLFDSGTVQGWPVVEQEVGRLLGRIGTETEVCVKFDERKLAYDINRRKRGLYVLTYFNAEPDKIADLERDVRLSELVLRVLVLRAENVTEDRITELKAHPVEQSLLPASSEGRRGDDDWRSKRGRPGPAFKDRKSAVEAPTPKKDDDLAGKPAPPPPTQKFEADSAILNEPAVSSSSLSGATVTESAAEPVKPLDAPPAPADERVSDAP